MSELDSDLVPRQGLGAIAVVIIATLAFGTGAGIGAGVGWTLKAPEEKIVEKPRDLTQDELAAACAPLVQDATDQLAEATEKVTTLETQVSAKETEVAQLEAEVAQGKKLSADQTRRLEAARSELDSLKRQLSTAQAQKAELEIKLAETQVQLDAQLVETERARGDATSQKWSTFAAQSQIDICEKGGRKAMEKCRETVEAKIRRVRTDFERCVRSGQAMPELKEAGKDQKLPEFARWLDDDDKVVKGWYVQLCDPSLPEAGSATTPQE